MLVPPQTEFYFVPDDLIHAVLFLMHPNRKLTKAHLPVFNNS